MLTAILVAAGSSQRMGFDKLFAPIAGKPVIAHTIRAFERARSVDGVIVVAREDRHDEIKTIVRDEKFEKVRSIIPGGKHRQDSVRAGLNHLDPVTGYVAVHDAARPLITPEQIDRVFQQCANHGAAALAEPINDTLKRADNDLLVSSSVDRHQLYAMQTPQIFERQLIEEASDSVARWFWFSTMISISKSLTREICRLRSLCLRNGRILSRIDLVGAISGQLQDARQAAVADRL